MLNIDIYSNLNGQAVKLCTMSNGIMLHNLTLFVHCLTYQTQHILRILNKGSSIKDVRIEEGEKGLVTCGQGRWG